jgi:phosphohistidine phosphatase
MKKLFIIRHAKSDWDNPNLDDFDRPLNNRGLKAAPMMGQRLKTRNIMPDMILSSPASRAITTAQLIAKEIGFEKSITQNHYIYEAYVNSLQETVSYIHDENDTVFLVGHNPGVSALAYVLADFKEQLPTCAVVEIQFECHSWLDVSKDNASVISYDYPKKRA